MIVRSVIQGLLGLCFILSLSETYALTPAEVIKEEITDFIRGQLQNPTAALSTAQANSATILVSDISADLNLRPCDELLTIHDFQFPTKKKRQVISVSCSSPSHWRLYVPVSIKLAPIDTLLEENIIARANDVLGARLKQAATLPTITEQDYQLTIANNFPIAERLPKACSEYIEPQLKKSEIKPGNLYIKFVCRGLPSWSIQVPMKLQFAAKHHVDKTRLEREIAAYIESHIPTIAELNQPGSRVVFNFLKSANKEYHCYSPLSYSIKDEKLKPGRNTIIAECPLFNPWQQPIQIQLLLYKKVAFTTHVIQQGQKVAANDLLFKELEISDISNQHIDDPKQAVGLVARKTLAANQVVHIRDFDSPKLIKTGDEVVLTAETFGILVRIPGIALSDGSVGEQINVQNKQSKKIVKGWISGPGQIDVVM